MNLQELERIVKHILDNDIFEQKLADYTYLISNLRGGPIADNEEYKRTFRSFFEFKRGIKHTKKEEYFKYMDEVKANKKIDNELAEKVYNKVCLITGRNEISFASKMIHVIDNSWPIWDSIVATDHFGFERCADGDLETRKTITWNRYMQYKDLFCKYMESADGQKIVDLFDGDERFQNSIISDVKKTDFILWRDENNEIIIPEDCINPDK